MSIRIVDWPQGPQSQTQETNEQGMRIHIVDPETGQSQGTVPAENPDPGQNTVQNPEGRTDRNILTASMLKHQLENAKMQNIAYQRQVAELERQNAEAQRQIGEMQRQLAEATSRIGELSQTCEQLRSQSGSDEISADDLEDTQSIIAEQRARIEALENALSERNANAENSVSAETAQRQETEIQALRLKLQQMTAEKETAVAQRDAALSQTEEKAGELERTKQALAAFTQLENFEQQMSESRKALANVQAQIAEIEQEKGTAFDALRELNVRYRKDLKYIEFYQKIPSHKIDGLELFRSKLEGLNEQLSKILEEGLQKAYVFKSTALAGELEERQQQVYKVIEAMRQLAEQYEMPEETPVLTEMSTEACRRQAEEALETYEKTLKQMYEVSEKFLRIKNTISFSFS